MAQSQSVPPPLALNHPSAVSGDTQQWSLVEKNNALRRHRRKLVNVGLQSIPPEDPGTQSASTSHDSLPLWATHGNRGAQGAAAPVVKHCGSNPHAEEQSNNSSPADHPRPPSPSLADAGSRSIPLQRPTAPDPGAGNRPTSCGAQHCLHEVSNEQRLDVSRHCSTHGPSLNGEEVGFSRYRRVSRRLGQCGGVLWTAVVKGMGSRRRVASWSPMNSKKARKFAAAAVAANHLLSLRQRQFNPIVSDSKPSLSAFRTGVTADLSIRLSAPADQAPGVPKSWAFGKTPPNGICGYRSGANTSLSANPICAETTKDSTQHQKAFGVCSSPWLREDVASSSTSYEERQQQFSVPTSNAYTSSKGASSSPNISVTNRPASSPFYATTVSHPLYSGSSPTPPNVQPRRRPAPANTRVTDQPSSSSDLVKPLQDIGTGLRKGPAMPVTLHCFPNGDPTGHPLGSSGKSRRPRMFTATGTYGPPFFTYRPTPSATGQHASCSSLSSGKAQGEEEPSAVFPYPGAQLPTSSLTNGALSSSSRTSLNSGWNIHTGVSGGGGGGGGRRRSSFVQRQLLRHNPSVCATPGNRVVVAHGAPVNSSSSGDTPVSPIGVGYPSALEGRRTSDSGQARLRGEDDRQLFHYHHHEDEHHQHHPFNKETTLMGPPPSARVVWSRPPAMALARHGSAPIPAPGGPTLPGRVDHRVYHPITNNSLESINVLKQPGSGLPPQIAAASSSHWPYSGDPGRLRRSPPPSSPLQETDPSQISIFSIGGAPSHHTDRYASSTPQSGTPPHISAQAGPGPAFISQSQDLFQEEQICGPDSPHAGPNARRVRSGITGCHSMGSTSVVYVASNGSDTRKAGASPYTSCTTIDGAYKDDSVASDPTSVPASTAGLGGAVAGTPVYATDATNRASVDATRQGSSAISIPEVHSRSVLSTPCFLPRSPGADAQRGPQPPPQPPPLSAAPTRGGSSSCGLGETTFLPLTGSAVPGMAHHPPTTVPADKSASGAVLSQRRSPLVSLSSVASLAEAACSASGGSPQPQPVPPQPPPSPPLSAPTSSSLTRQVLQPSCAVEPQPVFSEFHRTPMNVPPPPRPAPASLLLTAGCYPHWRYRPSDSIRGSSVERGSTEDNRVHMLPPLPRRGGSGGGDVDVPETEGIVPSYAFPVTAAAVESNWSAALERPPPSSSTAYSKHSTGMGSSSILPGGNHLSTRIRPLSPGGSELRGVRSAQAPYHTRLPNGVVVHHSRPTLPLHAKSKFQPESQQLQRSFPASTGNLGSLQQQRCQKLPPSANTVPTGTIRGRRSQAEGSQSASHPQQYFQRTGPGAAAIPTVPHPVQDSSSPARQQLQQAFWRPPKPHPGTSLHTPVTFFRNPLPPTNPEKITDGNSPSSTPHATKNMVEPLDVANPVVLKRGPSGDGHMSLLGVGHSPKLSGISLSVASSAPLKSQNSEVLCDTPLSRSTLLEPSVSRVCTPEGESDMSPVTSHNDNTLLLGPVISGQDHATPCFASLTLTPPRTTAGLSYFEFWFPPSPLLRDPTLTVLSSSVSSSIAYFIRAVDDEIEHTNRALRQHVIHLLRNEILRFLKGSPLVSKYVPHNRTPTRANTNNAMTNVPDNLPSLDVVPYGSSKTHLFLPWSDIDLTITGLHPTPAPNIASAGGTTGGAMGGQPALTHGIPLISSATANVAPGVAVVPSAVSKLNSASTGPPPPGATLPTVTPGPSVPAGPLTGTAAPAVTTASGAAGGAASFVDARHEILQQLAGYFDNYRTLIPPGAHKYLTPLGNGKNKKKATQNGSGTLMRCRPEILSVLNVPQFKPSRHTPLLTLTFNATTGNTPPLLGFPSHVDISVCNAQHTGGEAIRVLKFYTAFLPTLRPLVLAVKQLLQRRQMNIPYEGGLSSYAVTLMVIAFLLTPELYNERMRDVGYQLINFLAFYGDTLPPSKPVVHVSCLPSTFGSHPPLPSTLSAVKTAPRGTLTDLSQSTNDKGHGSIELTSGHGTARSRGASPASWLSSPRQPPSVKQQQYSCVGTATSVATTAGSPPVSTQMSSFNYLNVGIYVTSPESFIGSATFQRYVALWDKETKKGSRSIPIHQHQSWGPNLPTRYSPSYTAPPTSSALRLGPNESTTAETIADQTNPSLSREGSTQASPTSGRLPPPPAPIKSEDLTSVTSTLPKKSKPSYAAVVCCPAEKAKKSVATQHVGQPQCGQTGGLNITSCGRTLVATDAVDVVTTLPAPKPPTEGKESPTSSERDGKPQTAPNSADSRLSTGLLTAPDKPVETTESEGSLLVTKRSLSPTTSEVRHAEIDPLITYSSSQGPEAFQPSGQAVSGPVLQPTPQRDGAREASLRSSSVTDTGRDTESVVTPAPCPSTNGRAVNLPRKDWKKPWGGVAVTEAQGDDVYYSEVFRSLSTYPRMDSFMGYRLEIRDPVDASNNVGRPSYNISGIKTVFLNAYRDLLRFPYCSRCSQDAALCSENKPPQMLIDPSGSTSPSTASLQGHLVVDPAQNFSTQFPPLPEYEGHAVLPTASTTSENQQWINTTDFSDPAAVSLRVTAVDAWQAYLTTAGLGAEGGTSGTASSQTSTTSVPPPSPHSEFAEDLFKDVRYCSYCVGALRTII